MPQRIFLNSIIVILGLTTLKPPFKKEEEESISYNAKANIVLLFEAKCTSVTGLLKTVQLVSCRLLGGERLVSPYFKLNLLLHLSLNAD